MRRDAPDLGVDLHFLPLPNHALLVLLEIRVDDQTTGGQRHGSAGYLGAHLGRHRVHPRGEIAQIDHLGDGEHGAGGDFRLGQNGPGRGEVFVGPVDGLLELRRVRRTAGLAGGGVTGAVGGGVPGAAGAGRGERVARILQGALGAGDPVAGSRHGVPVVALGGQGVVADGTVKGGECGLGAGAEGAIAVGARCVPEFPQGALQLAHIVPDRPRSQIAITRDLTFPDEDRTPRHLHEDLSGLEAIPGRH